MAADKLTFDGLPGRTLHLWLFRNVKNAGELQKQVQARQVEPECAFINAALVADAWLVHLAAFKALAAEARGGLKTRSLHGEIVHNLSGTKHIGESFKRYGITADTRDVMVGRFDLAEGEESAILKLVDGEPQSPQGVASTADLAALQKLHKWTPAEAALGDPVGAVATRIAARDC